MQTIFITGASSGMGKASAKLFQSKGWNVIATMRSPEKETELTQLENVTILPLILLLISPRLVFAIYRYLARYYFHL
ncbi:Serine 3-dehydrogenase [Chryseobacterium indoltheticum]|uniref:Serine 3-dehydrogenase n=1 Tax=Chryseobacterium indoltheticum TaxID=254 RepID=A0A381FQ69_9FLAO|nr:Serine 3-dehydrogenase [Chryseobacterium indoltheticum]